MGHSSESPSEAVKRRLPFHQNDFFAQTKRHFNHFLCPLLGLDDNVPLQRGHVINEAFAGAPNHWVVQRKDIDSFFGRYFEADFDVFLHMHGKPLFEHFADKKIHNRFPPKIEINGRFIKYFLLQNESGVIWVKDRNYQPIASPNGDPILHFDSGDGRSVLLCLNTKQFGIDGTADALAAKLHINADCKVAAFVTILKAAHLSLFSVLGYSYSLSIGGVFIGPYLLGKFFLENNIKGRKKEEIQKAATHFFRPYKHLMRPITSEGSAIQGTLVLKQA